MNQILTEREHKLDFMSWDQNPKKRKTNNVVKFNINENVAVNIGDVLHGDFNRPFRSEYTITEVIEERPSTIKGKKYVTVKTEWQSVNVEVSNN